MGYIVLIIVAVLLDQGVKYLVEMKMMEGMTLPVIGEFFHITYVQNRGIAFGMFQGKLDIISIVTICVIIGISCYCIKKRDVLTKLEKLGYSLILSGAFGNIIDRLFRGFVVDMIDFRGIWRFVFNIADVWINIGVALIILDSIIDKKNKKK